MSVSDYSANSLRTGAWHFLTGKAATTALTLFVLLAAIRLLPVSEYATYVTLYATAELCLVIGSFGLPWLASRYVPELNLRVSTALLRRLCLRLLAVQLLALCVVALMLAAVSRMVNIVPEHQPQVMMVAALVAMVLIEGSLRFVRDSLLASLMMQRAARFSLVLRQFSLAFGLGAISVLGLQTGLALFLVECVAATLATAAATRALFIRLRQGSAAAPSAPANEAAPEARQQYGVALWMYAAHLSSLAYSPLVLLHILQRTAGPEAVALFGFLRLVHDQVARFLPAMLLFSLVRPKLMVSYLQNGIEELNRNVILFGKLSLFVLCPVIAAMAVVGGGVVSLISAGRFQGADLVMLGFALALVPSSQRQLLESVAVAADRSRLCTLASAISAFTLPLLYGFWSQTFSVVTAVACMLLGHTIFNVVLAFWLRRQLNFRGDMRGWFKLLSATVLAAGAGWAVADLVGRQGWGVAAVGFTSLVVFLGVSWGFKPFSQEERGRINTLLRRKVFIW